MENIHVKTFLVSGMKVRTNNTDERNSQTAKIPTLWQDFYGQNIPQKLNSNDNVAYGIYTNYESDFQGNFDVCACVKVEQKSSAFENISIANGKYLVFKKNGQMPQAVIEAWQDVWSYFETSHEKRAYTTDFEKYINESEVELYIAIQ